MQLFAKPTGSSIGGIHQHDALRHPVFYCTVDHVHRQLEFGLEHNIIGDAPLFAAKPHDLAELGGCNQKFNRVLRHHRR